MTVKELILTHILQCSRADLYIHNVQLNAQQREIFDSMVQRIELGEPLQYVLGECEFRGYRLQVDPRVLIPRPETELLVEIILQELSKDCKIDEALIGLDIGVGSGNITIALLKEMAHLQMVGMDVSLDALELCLNNVNLNKVEARTSLINADVCAWLQEPCDRQFSFVVSNPPYIKREDLKSLPKDVQREPTIALDGGEDGLKFYRVMVANLVRILKPHGWLFFEIGEDQGKSLDNLLTAQGSFVNIAIIKDYNQKDRFVKAQLSL